jgi:uncharacterized protein (DUF427 family)
MSSRVRDVLMRELDELRYEPTEKRVRAMLGDQAAADSTRAMLVWEPRRIVPSYAFPSEDVSAELVPEPSTDGDAEAPPVLSPGVPFATHTADGETLGVRMQGETRDRAAFRLADPDLDGYVVFDFFAFDAWYEEDEQIVGHPRDPFHRIDTRQSSRHVRIELDGELLADSSRPRLLFETNLPPRYYLPREDVVAKLAPSSKLTRCAYKGEASHWSVEVAGPGGENLAWSYEQPLPDSIEIVGLVAFYNERVDVIVDGERRERPHTEWS